MYCNLCKRIVKIEFRIRISKVSREVRVKDELKVCVSVKLGLVVGYYRPTGG